ncbi:MAG: HAD-IIA family hydrolase [Acidimicrobiales bacterium]
MTHVTAGAPDRVFEGYAMDLDGTVYLGDELLEGAQLTLTALRGFARVVFVTNKPLETAASYADKLTRLGIPATDRDVVTPLDSLVHYLDEHHRGAPLLSVAEELVDQVLRDAGYVVTTNPLDAGVVVVSFDRTFTYAKLLAAYQAVRHGAVIIATNPDPFCPTPEGGLPDCAAMLAAVETCTGVRAEAIVGKPSAHMGRAILSRLGVEPEESVIVGDRLLTDIAMADELGMSSVLVLTGVTSLEDVARSDVHPDYVARSLLELLPRQERP